MENYSSFVCRNKMALVYVYRLNTKGRRKPRRSKICNQILEVETVFMAKNNRLSNIIEIYFLIILEVRSLRTWCWHG